MGEILSCVVKKMTKNSYLVTIVTTYGYTVKHLCLVNNPKGPAPQVAVDENGFYCSGCSRGFQLGPMPDKTIRA